MVYGKIWMRDRLKKIVKNLKIKVKKKGKSCIFAQV